VNWQQAIVILQATLHSPDYKRTHAQGLTEDSALDMLRQVAQEWEALKQAAEAKTKAKP
jgi:predicted RNase H-like HicB family nuclease